MEGGPCVPLARVPSRPSCARPPFPRPPQAHTHTHTPHTHTHPPHTHTHPPHAHTPASAPAHSRAAPATGEQRAARSADNWRRRNNNNNYNNGNNNNNNTPQEPDRPIPNAIVVSGYPPFTKPQDLAHLFSKFGAVRFHQQWVSDSEAYLEFGAPAAAAAALRARRSLSLYGAFLHVRPATARTVPQRQPRRREPRVKQTFKGTSVDPADIPLEGAFPQQLEALLAAVRLSPPELERLAALYRDIEQKLQEIWPGCCAIPFGSVTTGLGVKSSDADCFVSVPAGGAPAPGGPHNAVSRAKRLLQAHPQTFGSLLAIPRANTPIVKFQHLPTGVYCDLSFKTVLGARNSKLVAFLLFSDPRLVPMAVVVKYWARVHDLSGTGKITNYALTMLIIFYLQQDPAILPPIEWLQRDRGDDYVVDHWNTGFMSDARRLPPSANSASVEELLGGFFEFYSTFDFDRLVACPYLGRAIPKDDFRDLNLLPAEFDRYKTNVTSGATLPLRFMTPLCVQDPLEQSHNVASPVSGRLLADLRAYLQFAAAAYRAERPGCAGLLAALLRSKPELPRKRGKAVFRARLPHGIVAKVAAPDWKAVVRDVTAQIFETILKIPLERIEDEENENAPRNGAITDKEKETYEGAVTRAIWKRKRFAKFYSVMGLRLLERETKITDEILRTDRTAVDVRFRLTLTLSNAPRAAAVLLDHVGGDLSLHKEFGKFFNSTFQQWFVVLYRPYCGGDRRPPGDGKAGAAMEEEAAAKELKEVMKRNPGDEDSSSGSDTDSYEDERTPPADRDGPDPPRVERGADEQRENDTNVAVKNQSENDETKLGSNLTGDEKNPNQINESPQLTEGPPRESKDKQVGDKKNKQKYYKTKSPRQKKGDKPAAPETLVQNGQP